jgi:hypothetical protein
MIEAAAIPTITTHRNTASSEIFINSFSVPRTDAKTKQVGGRRERGEGSALQCVTRSESTEDAEMRRFAAAAYKI